MGDEKLEEEVRRRTWPGFADRALAMLQSEAGEPFAHSRGVSRPFRVVVLPSFTDCVTYQLIEREPATKGESHRWIVTERRWRQSVDGEKFWSPIEWMKHRGELAPTIEVRMAHAETEWAKAVTSTLERVAVPLMFRGGLGIDGTVYELWWGRFGTGIKVRWWESGPAEWSPLTATIRAFLSEVEGWSSWEPLPP